MMLRWFQALMPKEEKFFDLFVRHAETIVAGAEALRGVLRGGDTIAAYCKTIVEREAEADEITREVMLAVRRSFITPFDRSDIQGLASAMDDAIDQMHQTAKVITLFEVATFEPAMREMGDIIFEAAVMTREAVPLLRTIGKNVARINAYTEEITRIEERADTLHDRGRKELFVALRHTDPMGYIVGTEIYEHLEKVVDRFEDVANDISAIMVEQV
jgi:predicted phosphate transport protein (TIGR00153 family)